MPLSDYHVIGLVGEGSFGKVYKGRRRYCGQVVAIKFIPTVGHSAAELAALRQERDILRTLRHPNIVQMLDCFETEDALCAVTEFASGTLFEVLQGDTALPEAAVLPIAAQLVDALHYLHSHRVIHRDMKPQNILLGANSRVMLCDFGFARAMSQQTTVLASIKGTPLYMAPELLQEQPYDHTADLWALGVILYELYVGRPPFDTHNFFALVSMIVSKDVSRPENASLPFGSLLEGLLTKDPRRRLSYPALLHHPFLRGPCQQRTPAVVPHHALALRANFPGAFLSVLPVGCRDEEGAATRGAHAEAPPGPEGGGPVRAALAPGLEHAAQTCPPGLAQTSPPGLEHAAQTSPPGLEHAAQTSPPGLEHAAQTSPPGGGASGERSTSPREPSNPRSGSRPRDTPQEEVGRLLDSLRTAGSAAEARVLRRLLSLAASIDGATALWSHRERWGALEAPLSGVDGAAPDVAVLAAAQLWAALLRWPEARRCSASLLLRHRLDASLLAAIEPSRLRKLSSASRGGASSGRLLRAVSIAVYAPFGEGGEEEEEALVALQQALHEAGLVKTLLRALAEASPHDREVSVSLLARLVLGSRHFLRQLLCDGQCGDQGGEPCDGRCGLTAAAAAACLDPRCSAASLVNALLLLCHAARAAGSRRDVAGAAAAACLTGPGATTSAASASPPDGDWTGMLLRARLPQCLTPLLRHDELAVRSKACTLVGTLCRLSSAFYEPVRAAGLPPLVAACGTHEVSSLRRAGSFALAEVARLERLT